MQSVERDACKILEFEIFFTEFFTFFDCDYHKTTKRTVSAYYASLLSAFRKGKYWKLSPLIYMKKKTYKILNETVFINTVYYPFNIWTGK